MNWLTVSVVLLLASQSSKGFWVDTTGRDRPIAESNKDEKACELKPQTSSTFDFNKAIDRQKQCMTAHGWKVSDCSQRDLVIDPDGYHFELDGSALDFNQMKNEIRKMGRSTCPPFIRAKGVPPAVDPVLQEFKRSGYDMRKIIFN